MLLCAHRLPAVRLCLLFLAVVLSSATVSAFTASIDPSRAVASSLSAVGMSAPSPRQSPRGRQSAGSHRLAAAGRVCCRGTHRQSSQGRRQSSQGLRSQEGEDEEIKPSASPKLGATEPSSSPAVDPRPLRRLRSVALSRRSAQTGKKQSRPSKNQSLLKNPSRRWKKRQRKKRAKKKAPRAP